MSSSNIFTLGYPCFHLNQNNLDSFILDVIWSTFPLLRELVVFSCYITTWRLGVEGFEHHRLFGLTYYEVHYDVDLPSDF